jgi:hypothetical protein
LLRQPSTGQYVILWPLNFSQCFNHDPHEHPFCEVFLTFFIFIFAKTHFPAALMVGSAIRLQSFTLRTFWQKASTMRKKIETPPCFQKPFSYVK